MFGASLAAHLSEGLPRAQEEFLSALADLANTHPQDVGENQVYEVYSKAIAVIPIELDHVRRVLTTMSDGEAHTSHLAPQTNMVIARRAAYLDHSSRRPRIHLAIMALPIENSKLFAGKVQEARLWDAEEDEVDQRKAFLKPSSSTYHKQQTYAKALLRGSRLLQLLCQNPSPPPHRLRRILAPSSGLRGGP